MIMLGWFLMAIAIPMPVILLGRVRSLWTMCVVTGALLFGGMGLAKGAEPDPCASASPTCRQAAGEAILTWRTEALTAERHLAGCEERLAARTSTVIRELVPVPLTHTATIVEPAGLWSPWTLTGGAVGVVVGVLLGVLVAR